MITVGVTFSEAVTVTGTPQITLDIGGTERTADYSGAGTATGQLLFSYTVQPVDQDDDGVAVVANSLALNGGTIQSADGSTGATLTHSAMAFPSHKVDTELVLISNMGQADGTALRINAGERVRLSFEMWASGVIYDLNQIVLDVKTPSDTLNLGITTVVSDDPGNLNATRRVVATFTGSVATAGKQRFRSSNFTYAVTNISGIITAYIPGAYVEVYLTASGSGYVELGTTASMEEDSPGAYRWSIADSVYRSTDGGTTYTEQTSAHLPRLSVVGHTTETLRILAADIVSEPYDGVAYAAGERIEARIFLNGAVRALATPLTVPLHFGDEAQHRREAGLATIRGDYTSFSLHPTSPQLREYVLYFAYTVQPGDMDTDGVVLGANPLGTESDGKIEYALDTRVRMELSFPAQGPSASHLVNGEQTSACDAVHCAYLTAVEGIAEPPYIFSGYFAPAKFRQLTGNISGRLFSYGGREYFFRRNSVYFNPSTDGGAGDSEIVIWFTQPLQDLSVQRLGWQAGDTAFAFADAETSLFDAPTSEEDGFEHVAEYSWSTTGLRWNPGDRILVKIVEMPVTATFDAATYAADEGGSVEVTVALGGSFETKTVTLPIRAAGSGGATAADYSGIPANLVFAPGDTEKSFTVTLTDDDVDDDGESLTLSFGSESNIKSGGANETATVAIRDDDDPAVTVSFGASTYTAAEGGTATVTVTLSADPERTVEVPITKTNQGGASAADYSGVPASVTFDAGDTSKTFTFTAVQDTVDDDDESVDLAFGTLPSRVSAGTTAETAISITDDDDPEVTVSFDSATYTREVDENTGADQDVGSPVTASDTQSDALTYTLGGADAASFEIASTSGQIQTKAGVTYDHEAKSSYTVTVTASDGNGGTATATVTITINDVNEPPLAPTEVDGVAVPRTYDQITVFWTAPDNAGRPPITGYDVQYVAEFSVGGTYLWTDWPQSVQGTFATITGLEHTSTFPVRVRAKNDEGDSPWAVIGGLYDDYSDELQLPRAGTNLLPHEIPIGHGFIPPGSGLGTGDSFRLLFVSYYRNMLLEQQNATDATAQSIWDYYDHISSHVIDENAPSEGLSIADYSLTDLHLFYPFFFPVASTKLVDAGVLTNTTYTNDDKGVPIYWVGGSKVADDYEDFYDGSWDDEANVRDATGALITAPARVWTGSASDGTALMVNGVSHALGQPQAGYATPGSTVSGAGPLHSGSTAANTEEYPMYGLSTAFRIVALGQVSNLGQSGRSTDERSARRSQRFTTGAHLHGYENLGIQIAYRGAENRAGYSLSIYTVDTSGHPGTRVANLTYPDADSGQELTFDAPDNTVLDPNTTYAIVVTHNTATDEVTLSATTSDDEDDEGEDDWSISDAFDIESGGSWSADTDGRSLRIRVRATLKVGPPGKPTGLTANAVGRDRINLSWTAPSMDGGSAITGYLVESSADGSMGWTDVVADTGTTTTSYSHTGLHPNTTLYYRVSAINVEGTSGASDTANATTDDFPDVTVQFRAATYTVAEGSSTTVTVTLSEDPLQTTVIPLAASGQGGASSADYSGVPASVTFNAGQTSTTITFSATQDTEDDDGESVKLAFGALPTGVSAGATAETTVAIRDDDDPQVTVSFGAATYTAAEGGTVTVTVTLSADPERMVEVPITTTNQGGAWPPTTRGCPPR